MFRIVVDGKVFYDDTLPDDDLKLINPTLNLEDNEPGELSFTIPNNHRYANATNSFGKPILSRKSETVTVYKNGEWYWEGRPFSNSVDFYNRRTIKIEGALAYLKDTIQPMSNTFEAKYSDYHFAYNCNHSNFLERCIYEFVDDILHTHNLSLKNEYTNNSDMQYMKQRRIFLGPISLVDSGTIVMINGGTVSCNKKTYERKIRWPVYFNNTYELIQNIIDTYGGHIRVRRSTVSKEHLPSHEITTESCLLFDYLYDYTSIGSQTIEFGKNLLDYSTNMDYGDIVTAVVPLGSTIDKNSPYFNSGSKYSSISQKWNIGILNSYLTDGAYKNPRILMQDVTGSNNLEAEYGYFEKTIDFGDVEMKLGYNGNLGWSTIENYQNSSNSLQSLSNDPDGYNYKDSNNNKYYEDDTAVFLARLFALEILGKDYLANVQFDKMELELTVFDLKYLDSNIDDLIMLNYITCSSIPHGMYNKKFPLTKMSIALDSPEETKLTLGYTDYKKISYSTGKLIRRK